MKFDQALAVFTPLVFGLAAFVLAFRMMRPDPTAARQRPENAVGAVLLLLVGAGCVLGSFALWVCVGISRGTH